MDQRSESSLALCDLFCFFIVLFKQGIACDSKKEDHHSSLKGQLQHAPFVNTFCPPDSTVTYTTFVDKFCPPDLDEHS